ncbi:MAG: C10 family peptidase, partial [Lentisphaeria bacterium]|nr:C10 family peptidase [Lentisphaeria bacterium]
MGSIYEYKDTYGEPASTYTVNSSISTGIMLSTLWNQSGIVNIDGNTTITYNEYCPLDGDEHSLTGCTNTAAAQIIYYFIEKYNLDLKLTLTAEDEYTSNYEGLEIDIKADGSTPGTVSFNAVNSKIANFDIKSADDIAALNYACGVVQKAAYSADATSTSWRTVLFLRSGFYCAIGSNIESKYYWGIDNGDDSYSISDGGFEVLIENLAAGRVVGTSFPGHALVIDGYDSATDKFHINYGWGDSSSTGWYSRKEMNDQGYYYFMYDLMQEKVTTLTVNDSDLYGTGTMLRAFEQAQGISGDNIIEFTNAVKGKSLVLRDYITFADKTTVNNFNMSISFTDERYSNYGFYLNSGSTAVFNNFSGEVFVNTGENYNYAFYTGNGQGIDITTNGALIYAGQYKINNDLSAGTTAVQSAMRAYQNNKTAISSNILESRKYSVYGSANSDKLTLDNNTVVIGNVQLNDGNDVLSISGNSHLFGDVYLNSGNDTVSVTGNSHISGDINTGDGSDTVTIDSTSSVTGGFYNIENLQFDLLSQHNTQAMYYVMYNVYNVYSYTTSIVADITLATIGSYLLFEADANANYSSYLQNLSITVSGGELTENFVLNAKDNSHCSYADLIYRDNKLYLDVIGYTPGDTTPPSVPGNISSTVAGNGVTISWSAATDNNRVYCYRVRYGKSSELTGDGDVVYDLDTVFSSLANGTYYYQVCAVDASGNKSNW